MYLPGHNSLFEVCVKIRPAFEIARVSSTHIEGFNYAGYLLRPELVQFNVTSFDLSQRVV